MSDDTCPACGMPFLCDVDRRFHKRLCDSECAFAADLRRQLATEKKRADVLSELCNELRGECDAAEASKENT